MAQTAEKLRPAENPRFSGQVVPMRGRQGASVSRQEQALGVPSRAQSPMRERLRNAKRRAGDVLISTKQSVAKGYRNAQERAADSFTNLASASRDVTRRARSRAEQIKKEHPLQLLAVVAGTALVLGIVARVWRSRHHA